MKNILLMIFLLFAGNSFAEMNLPENYKAWGTEMVESGQMNEEEVQMIAKVVMDHLHLSEEQVQNIVTMEWEKYRRSLPEKESGLGPLPPHIKAGVKLLYKALKPETANAPTEGPGMRVRDRGNEGERGRGPRRGGGSSRGGGGGGGVSRPIASFSE